MSPTQSLLLVYGLVVAACVVAAIVALAVGYRLYQPLLLAAPVRRRPVAGGLLMLSSIAWLGLAAYQQIALDERLALQTLTDLPATAAGFDAAPAVGTLSKTSAATAMATASIATLAEELAADPHNPDFQQLRGKVTRLLYEDAQFGRYPHPVLLTLPEGREGETIRYLAEERPGLLTVIYHAEADQERRMLVYWPEVAGEQLIYTPLSGPASQALSQLVQDALTN